MLRFAADENFNNDILRGLFRHRRDLDIVRIQDVGLTGAEDPAVLEWAAREGRVSLTHDVSTMTRHAYDCVRSGKHMAGIFEISRASPIRTIIDDILLLAEFSLDNEWEEQVRYLPLR